MVPLVKAMCKVPTNRFLARAEVETEAPEVAWRFLVACVVEHGGEASTEEICQHLIGAPRHPFIERLLDLASMSGGLTRDANHWRLGPTARELLATGTRRILRTGEFEFHLHPERRVLISVRRQQRPDRLWDSIQSPATPASDADAQQIREAVGRRFADGVTLRRVEEPIIVAGKSEEEVLEEVSLTAEQLDELIPVSLPADFKWDPLLRAARSGLDAVVNKPQYLTSRTISDCRVPRIHVSGRGHLSDVVVGSIPWVPWDDVDENEVKTVTMLASIFSVQDQNTWPLTLAAAGVAISRLDAAVMAHRWGADLAYKMLMAAEDWRL